MNEVIEKLGEQVDLLGECTPTKIPGRYVGYITEEQILKFAKLIVEETMKQVDERTCSRDDTSWYNDDKDWVRLHFGYGKLTK